MTSRSRNREPQGKRKSADGEGAKSPPDAATAGPGVAVSQNASPAKVQRQSHRPKSPTRSLAAPASKAASPVSSGAASPALGGRHVRARGSKSSARSPAAAASQAASTVASGAASTDTTGRKVHRGSRKQRPLSPKQQASPVVLSPGSPTRATPAKSSGKDRKEKKGSASGPPKGPLVKSAASGVSSVPAGSKGAPASATAATSSTGKAGPPGGSQAANEKEEGAAGAPPSLTAAENKQEQQKAIESSMVELPTVTRDAKRNNIIIPVVVCLGVILAVATVGLIIYITSWHIQYFLPLCHTEDCRKHAKLLTGNIDWEIDPCEDFAAYVCSAARDFASRGGTRVTSVMDVFVDSWYRQFEDMLRKGVDKVPVGKKALAMYEKCLSYSSDQPHPKVFIDFLEHQGLAWPQPPEQVPSPLDYIVNLAYTWQIPPVDCRGCASFAGQDEATSPRRARHRDLRSTKRSSTAFETSSGTFSTGCTLSSPPKLQRRRCFPSAIYRTTQSMPRPPAWVASFQHSLLLQPELGLDDNIVVSDVTLLGAIGDIFSKYNDKELYIHLTWLLVQYYAPVIDYRLLIDFYGGADKAAAYLSTFCSLHVEATYRVVALAIGLASRFTAQDRKTIDDGFDGLVSAAIDKVVESNWIGRREQGAGGP
ncbi:hypothetical protein MTO96_011086 [Rhipicephalus appendiculatus]